MQYFDFLIMLILSVITGYITGFMTVKVNNLLIILSGKLWSSGHAKKRYILTTAVIGFSFGMILLLYYGINFQSEPSSIYEIIVCITAFTSLHILGIYYADNGFKKALIIIEKIAYAVYVDNNEKDNDGENKDEENKIISKTIENIKDILNAMPISNKHAVHLLFFVFNSAFMVFLISLIGGNVRTKQFIDLGSSHRKKYIMIWINNKYLSLAVQAMKVFLNFSYYTIPETWNDIPYNGTAFARSYLE